MNKTYDRILEQAARLFRDKGYSASSMEDIADAVGLKKGSLYYHFESKEQILVEIMDSFTEKLQAPVLALIDNDELGSAEKLRQAIKLHLGTLDSDNFEITVFLLEFRALSEEHRQRTLQGRASYETTFRRLIAEGIERGEFMDVDVAMAARAILGMCNWATQWYSPHGKHTTDQIASIFSDLVLNGLLKQR